MKNLYKILGLNKDASEQDIKKAYKKSALKWHPDRNANNKEEATEKFKEIARAYEILSDPQKRKSYDQFGEAGIKGSGEAGRGAGRGADGAGFTFTQGDASKVFEQFFGTSDLSSVFGQFQNGGGMNGSNGFNFSFGGTPGNFGNDMFTNNQRQRKKKAKTVYYDLNCSLEDLYQGKTKKIRIRSNRTGTEKILAVPVKPGWKEGTKLTYNGENDENENCLPGDIVFVVKQKPHKEFKRNGNDLICEKVLPRYKCQDGNIHSFVKKLDGQVLEIKINKKIQSGYVHKIPGKGMPISKQKGKYGDLYVRCKYF